MPPPSDSAPPTQSSERDEALGAGSLVDGKYRIEREIGSGGMGQVFAAVHVELGHTVAIKALHESTAHDTDAARRFVREGRAAAQLKSDHAVRINDVGRLSSGRPYLVMEYLEGEDLDRLRARHVLAVEDVVDYTLQALSALAEAHDVGLVHRDIKPQNLFLARLPDGTLRVKVLDFGLAKELPSMDRASSALTTEHMILGTPNFMSPEQIRNSIAVDARTDIWAMGATMFVLLTGQPPFDSGTTHGVLARILADSPSRARELRPDVPEALDDVIQRCLAKDVFARFQSVADLGAALRAASPPSARARATDEAPRTVQDGRPDDDEAVVPTEQTPAVEDPIPATVLAPLPATRRLPLEAPLSLPVATARLAGPLATMPTRTLPMPHVTTEVANAAAALAAAGSSVRIESAPSMARDPSSESRLVPTVPTARPLAVAPKAAPRPRRTWLAVLLVLLVTSVALALALRAARMLAP